MTTSGDIIQLALAQAGKPYVYGVEVNLDDPSPASFDCSELVQWVCHRLGVQPEMPDGSWIQYVHCKQHGLTLSVDEAVRTRGALLFTNRDESGRAMDPSSANDHPAQGHVAFSLGNGKTIEAMGTKWGVRQGDAAGRSWTQGALIPGTTYDVIAAPDLVAAVANPIVPDGTHHQSSTRSSSSESGGRSRSSSTLTRSQSSRATAVNTLSSRPAR